MIPIRTPDSPTPTVRLGDQLLGQGVDGSPVDHRLRRVVGAPVPAAAHHEVEPAPLGQALEPGGVAPDAGHREVDEGRPAGVLVVRELVEDHRLVARELPVVPAVRDVPERDLRVLVGQREPDRRRLDGPEDGHDVRHAEIVAARVSRRSLRAHLAPGLGHSRLLWVLFPAAPLEMHLPARPMGGIERVEPSTPDLPPSRWGASTRWTPAEMI